MKTTKADFRVFVAECERLRKLWKLDGYVLRYRHVQLDDGDQALCSGNYVQRGATLSLSTDWTVGHELEKTGEAIREMARHEMAHVLIGQLGILATVRFGNSQEMQACEHELVVRLMELLP
jgi:hypothetical protein